MSYQQTSEIKKTQPSGLNSQSPVSSMNHQNNANITHSATYQQDHYSTPIETSYHRFSTKVIEDPEAHVQNRDIVTVTNVLAKLTQQHDLAQHQLNDLIGFMYLIDNYSESMYRSLSG